MLPLSSYPNLVILVPDPGGSFSIQKSCEAFECRNWLSSPAFQLVLGLYSLRASINCHSWVAKPATDSMHCLLYCHDQPQFQLLPLPVTPLESPSAIRENASQICVWTEISRLNPSGDVKMRWTESCECDKAAMGCEASFPQPQRGVRQHNKWRLM